MLQIKKATAAILVMALSLIGVHSSTAAVTSDDTATVVTVEPGQTIFRVEVGGGGPTSTLLTDTINLEHSLGPVTASEREQAKILLAQGDADLSDESERIQQLVTTAVTEHTTVLTTKATETAGLIPSGSGRHRAGNPGCYNSVVQKKSKNIFGATLYHSKTTIFNWCFNSSQEFTSTPWVTRYQDGNWGWVTCGWTSEGFGSRSGPYGGNYTATGIAKFGLTECGLLEIGQHRNELVVRADGWVFWWN